jgi:hypothetical protein
VADNYDYYWWKKPKSELHEAIWPYLAKLSQNQGYRSDLNLRNMRLYANTDLAGLGAYSYTRMQTSNTNLNTYSYNVVKAVIDTLTAKITKQKPKPMFLTTNGDWSLKRKAKKLNQFIEGQFYSMKFYAKMAVAFKDSCMWGTGIVKLFEKDGQVVAERVFPDEITIDDVESYYGEPRQLHQSKYIHKEVLKAMFPGLTNYINEASRNHTGEVSNNENTEMVLVRESWHLPSKKGGTDGLHCITISNKTLFSEKWDKDYFPFIFLRKDLNPVGFWGRGSAENLTGIQLEISKLLKTVQVSTHLMLVPKLYVDAASKIVSAHLDNKIGGVIRYSGKAPVEGTLGQVPQQLFTQIENLYNKAFEQEGISQLSVNSQKPAGLNSGKALRTYNDIESERFQDVATRYQDAFLDAVPMIIDIIKGIYERQGEYSVKIPGKKFMDKIDWKDVSLEEDQYTLQMFPTSALSQNPSARLAEVQELLQAGFLSKEWGQKLLDFPDLEQYYSFTNSPIDDIERTIEYMVDKEEYLAPEPFSNLQLGIQMMQLAYNYYKVENAPENVLELMRVWMDDANAMLINSQKQMAAQQTPDAAAGLGAQAQPPVAELAPLEGATQNQIL